MNVMQLNVITSDPDYMMALTKKKNNTLNFDE